MGRLLSLRKFFKSDRDVRHGYKHRHFLNALSSQKLNEILLYAEADHLTRQIPDAANKKIVLFNDTKHRSLIKKVASFSSRSVTNYCYQELSDTSVPEKTLTLIGETDRLAIRKNHYDIAICPFVLEEFSFVEKFVRTLTEYMQNGTRLLLSLRHPQLENVLYNQNPEQSRVCDWTISRCFKMLRENNFYTEELHECPVDLLLRPFFSDIDQDYYSEYKNMPLGVIFKTVKYDRAKQKKRETA